MTKRSVVFLSLAAAIAVPICASAQDFTPTGERIISDPTYLPLRGQFFGDTGYAHDWSDGQRFDAAGTDVASRRATRNDIHQSFAYGVTDDLSVNVGMDYEFSDRTRVDSASGQSVTNRSGFENPTFGVTWRLLDERTHPVSLDLFTTYAPDAFAAKTADGTDDATAARGGAEFDVGAGLGRETRFFTIRGEATGRYFGNSTLDNSITGATIRTASYWVPSVGVATQTRFNDRLSLNVGADYNFNGSPQVVNSATGVQHIAQLGDYQDVKVGLNYHFIPNTLVGSVNYHHDFYDGNVNIFPADPTLNTRFEHSGDGVGVQLRYVFK